MTLSIDLILLILAAICFALAAFGVPTRFGLVPLGLLFWVMTLILPGR